MPESVHIVCPVCSAVNRVPGQRLGEAPLCGKCRERLFRGHPLELTAATFDRQVNGSGIPVVVDFWASWCGPCKTMAPVFAQASERLEPRVRVAKVNTETEQDLAARFGIQSIPTLILFREGKEAARQSGAMPLGALINWVETHI